MEDTSFPRPGSTLESRFPERRVVLRLSGDCDGLVLWRDRATWGRLAASGRLHPEQGPQPGGQPSAPAIVPVTGPPAVGAPSGCSRLESLPQEVFENIAGNISKPNIFCLGLASKTIRQRIATAPQAETMDLKGLGLRQGHATIFRAERDIRHAPQWLFCSGCFQHLPKTAYEDEEWRVDHRFRMCVHCKMTDTARKPDSVETFLFVQDGMLHATCTNRLVVPKGSIPGSHWEHDRKVTVQCDRPIADYDISSAETPMCVSCKHRSLPEHVLLLQKEIDDRIRWGPGGRGLLLRLSGWCFREYRQQIAPKEDRASRGHWAWKKVEGGHFLQVPSKPSQYLHYNESTINV